MFGLRFICLVALISSAFVLDVAAQKKSAKIGSGRSKSSSCGLKDLSFPCPSGLKVLRQDRDSGIFLAQMKQKDYSYAVFVVYKKLGNSDKDLMNTIETVLFPLLFPASSTGFAWRDLEFLNNSPVSNFEVRRKLMEGFNRKILVATSYRELSFQNKTFYAGSIWNEEETPEDAAELFEEATGIVEGPSCDKVVKIIRSVTRERGSPKPDPCKFEIIQTLDKPNL